MGVRDRERILEFLPNFFSKYRCTADKEEFFELWQFVPLGDTNSRVGDFNDDPYELETMNGFPFQTAYSVGGGDGVWRRS